MIRSLPSLDQPDELLRTEREHELALIAACRAAVVIMAAKGQNAADAQDPLPASSVELLKRLPRA